MEEKQFAQIAYSEEELAQQKKQKSRNRVFGILLCLSLLLTAVLIAEIVCLITR